MNTGMISPLTPATLRSSAKHQSGAFDLPSVLIGVAVVAILAIGVMATIFGVIPWTQDNAAKQDLGAIYTAQGSTYAKDDQMFKDLAGLEAAGLISGIDPEAAEITATNDGKGFIAKVTSDSGNTWFITHDNSVPRPWDEDAAPGTQEWASDICTPWVIEQVEWLYESYSDPDAVELAKWLNGAPDSEVDSAAVERWVAKYAETGAEPEDAPSETEWDAYMSIGTSLDALFRSMDANIQERMSATIMASCHP